MESATVVAHVAKRDGFGVVTSADRSNSEESTQQRICVRDRDHRMT